MVESLPTRESITALGPGPESEATKKPAPVSEFKIPASEIPPISQPADESRKPVSVKFEQPVSEVFNHAKRDRVSETALGGRDLDSVDVWELEEALDENKVRVSPDRKAVYVKFGGLVDEARISSEEIDRVLGEMSRKSEALTAIRQMLRE